MPAKKRANRTLRLSGEQTVRTIAEAHQALLSGLSDSDAVMLDATDVVDADLTLVQLIESARATAESLGKDFRVTGPIPAALKEQLERGGFLAGSSSTFWKSITP